MMSRWVASANTAPISSALAARASQRPPARPRDRSLTRYVAQFLGNADGQLAHVSDVLGMFRELGHAGPEQPADAGQEAVMATAPFRELCPRVDRFFRQTGEHAPVVDVHHRIAQQRILRSKVTEERHLVDARYLGDAPGGRAAGSRGAVHLDRRLEQQLPNLHPSDATRAVIGMQALACTDGVV